MKLMIVNFIQISNQITKHIIDSMEPTITDWIQAIGTLIGIPVGVWSIISLFSKNKAQDKQLESLETIAKSQNNVISKLAEQVEQLSIQSNHFQYQNSLMVESNKIMEKQFELQYDIFKYGQQVEEQKSELEKKKRLLEIRPFFVRSTAMSSPDSFKFYLRNNGGEAHNIRLIEIETKFASFNQLKNNLRIEKYNDLIISGTAKQTNQYFNGNNLTFSINIEFQDIDGNKYIQNVVRFQDNNYKIQDPELISLN